MKNLSPLVDEIFRLAEENRKSREENEQRRATLKEVRSWPDSM